MSLWDWLKDQFSHDAVQRTRVPIAASNDLTALSGVIAVAEKHYVRLWFSELFLKRDTEWFSTRFPLGFSLVAHKYGNQDKVEFANVAGKNKFDIGQVGQGRAIMRNFPMTPLLPFRGGDVEMDCGLVSMEAGNLLESFAKTVGDIAGRLNVPQVSSVIAIASSVAAGVQELMTAGKSRTVLTAHDMFRRDRLTSGYVLLSSAALTDFSDTTVWMTADGVRLGRDKNALAPLPPQDYLVVYVECLTTRDDWHSFSTIGKPLDDAIKAKLSGKDDDAKALLLQAKVAALTSPDLTRDDVKRVIVSVEQYFNEQAAGMEGPMMDVAQGSDSGTSAYHQLTRAMAGAGKVDLRGLPEPTMASILAGAG